MYLWERAGWPRFEWDAARLLAPLASARHVQGRVLGKMRALGFEVQQQAELEALATEVVRSSAIEGEVLDLPSVRSSIAHRLGWASDESHPGGRTIEGVVTMMLDATRGHREPLDAVRLFGWHAALFPTGYSGMHRIRVGEWRDDARGPMQVVSGPIGRTRVHYQAPPAARVPSEMAAFLQWFNQTPQGDGLLRAGIAHLWFVTIHPFEDGNGRIARAITERALSQLEDSEQRFYSFSNQLLAERNAYYAALETTQKGTTDITGWLEWFVQCFERALIATEAQHRQALTVAAFWARHADSEFNPRQRRVLNAFLSNFEGVLTAKKWAALTRCSIDTAQRDLSDLVTRGVLRRNPGGSKKTSYSLGAED